jgi:hypothetical protein
MDADCFMDSKAATTAYLTSIDMMCQAKVTQENMACVHTHMRIETRSNFVSCVLLISRRGLRPDNTKPRDNSLAPRLGV